MGIANYTNLSELMNNMLKTGHGISISDMVREAASRKFILASEGELADKADLENGFIALFDVHYHAGRIKPDPQNEMESHIVELYKNGDLAKHGYGGRESDLFLDVKWMVLIDSLPVITNINL